MSAIVKQTDAFTETEIDDEVVVMLLESGEFFSMTGTGRAIWRLIDGTRDRDALLAELAREYATRPADISSDVDVFLEKLREMGLVSPA